jgi:phenylacetate-coenzyme A ligase PaaK-like adenylate-forming protein
MADLNRLKSIYRRVYPRLPVALQNAALSTVGWHNEITVRGRGFVRLLDEYEARTFADPGAIRELRDARLRAFLLHAYETVPYYHELFDQAGLHPREVATLEDLASLPIMSKADVQDRRSEFLSSSVPRRRRKLLTTSGSTGSGLIVATTLEAVQEQWATWWRCWRGHGIERRTWDGILGSPSAVSPHQQAPPFWRYNRAGHELVFSSLHTSSVNIPHYVAELRRKKPPWLQGLPSQLALIASYLVETNTDLGYEVRWITSSTENLLPQQSRLIERAFGVKPIQHYGMTEAIANISECEKGKLHVDEELAATEFIPITGNRYRVVGTNISNPAMPLIRYECCDHVTIDPDDSCSCGRPGRVVTDIDGRQEDYIVLKNGVRLGRLDRIFYNVRNVHEAQIRQDKVGEIKVLVRPGALYKTEDELRLRTEIEKTIHDGSQITIEYVDEVERTARGKLRFVVSTVSAEDVVGYEVLPPPSLSALENRGVSP